MVFEDTEMDSFNINMILQPAKWWTIITIIKVYLILYIIYKLLQFLKGCLKLHGNLQKCLVPGIYNHLVSPYILLSQYKKATPECPAMCSGFEALVGFFRLYGKDGLLGGNFMFRSTVFYFKAEAAEALLGNAELIDKCREYRLFEPLVGVGLITSQRTKWRKHRKLLTPTFHFSILEDCIPVFQEQANVLNSKIKSRMQETWVDIQSLLTVCSLDIICQTAMGVSMNFQNEENGDYLNAFEEVLETVVYRGLRPWLQNDFVFNLTTRGKKFNSNLRLVHELHKKILKQKMDKITAEGFIPTIDDSNKYLLGKKMRKPFIEILLEHHLKDPSFTEKDVMDEVNTFISAGHETTSKAIGFVLYCLGRYPDVQRKVHEELDAIFSNEENENISREFLSKMKYLECVIKETLRLYPVAVFFARENNQDFKVYNYTVKKGTLNAVVIWELHRDPAVFPDPEKFIPERFFPENCRGRHPYAYIPFSAGSRNCIGQNFAMMEIKTVLACILRHFRVKSLDPRDKVLIYPSVTIANVQPLRVRFEYR